MKTNPTPTNTQTRLLHAAAELMWERSFSATSVDELCQKANAKKGSFYHFFSSKTDLAIAAIEGKWLEIKDTVFEPVFSSPASGLTQVENLVDQAHQFQMSAMNDKRDYLGCFFGNLGQEMARQDEKIRICLQRIFEEHYDYLEQALVKATKAKEIPEGDNRLRAKKLFALFEGGMLLAKVSNDPQLFLNIKPTIRLIAEH